MKRLMKKATSLLLAGVIVLGIFGAINVSATTGAMPTAHTVISEPHLLAKVGAGSASFTIEQEKSSYFQHELPELPEGAVVTSAKFYAKKSGFGGNALTIGLLYIRPIEVSTRLEGSFENSNVSSYPTTFTQTISSSIKDIIVTKTFGDWTDEFAEADITAVIKAAYEAGDTYFSYISKVVYGTFTVSKADTKQRPFIEISYAMPPTAVLSEIVPVVEGTAFDVSATITQGGGAIVDTAISVTEVSGTEYTDFSGPVVTDSSYVWSIPDTISAGSYTIKLTVTDENGLKAEDSIKVRVLGAESFATVIADGPVKTATTYNGKLLESEVGLKANTDSMVSYFEYDLKENGVYNVESVVWGCENTFDGGVSLYAITSGWDKDSIKYGNLPEIADVAFAESADISEIDITEYAIECFEKGETTIRFALKTKSGEVVIGADEESLVLSRSDNKRPEISLQADKSYGTGDVILVNVADDDIITEVTATIDGAFCTIEQSEDEKWNVILPEELTEGVHKLTVTAKDYSEALTTTEFAVNIGSCFEKHTLTTSSIGANASVMPKEEGLVLLLAAYKDGMLHQIALESDVADGVLSTAVDLSAEGSEGVTYASFVCKYTDGFKVLDIK